jgi:hypothetical protein
VDVECIEISMPMMIAQACQKEMLSKWNLPETAEGQPRNRIAASKSVTLHHGVIIYTLKKPKQG